MFGLLADGLAPPFFAQMGPSVLDNNVFLKNIGSGIKWETLEEIESNPTVGLSLESGIPKPVLCDCYVDCRMATSTAHGREAEHARAAVRCGASFAPWRMPLTALWLPPCRVPPRPCPPRLLSPASVPNRRYCWLSCTSGHV